MEHRAITETACDTPVAEPLAVKTAPTRPCTPVGAVSTAKLWIQNPQWSAGFCRDRLRYLPPPNHSRSRQLPHVKCTPRGSEAFDPHARRCAGYYRDGLRYLQTPNDSRSRPLPHVHARPVGAVSTAKLLIQTHNGAQGYYRDSLRYLQPPNHSRSRPLPHVNARPVGAVSTAKLLIHTHDGAPAITETACDTSKRRTTRGQDRSHTSMVAGKGASC